MLTLKLFLIFNVVDDTLKREFVFSKVIFASWHTFKKTLRLPLPVFSHESVNELRVGRVTRSQLVQQDLLVLPLETL